MDGEGQHDPTAGPGAFALGGGVHTEGEDLCDAVAAQRLGDVRKQSADPLYEVGGGPAQFGRKALQEVPAAALLEHGDEAEVVTAARRPETGRPAHRCPRP